MNLNFLKKYFVKSLRLRIVVLVGVATCIGAILVGGLNYFGADLAFSIITIGASLLAMILFTNKLTRPLKIMTREISAFKGQESLNLPINLQDEIGELARSFKEKIGDLFASEEKMQTIVNNIIDGIITVNQSGKIDSYSDVCINIFGYKAEEVLGKNFSLLFRAVSNDKIQDFLNKRCELIGLKKNGREFPLEIFVNKIAFDDHDLFCCVVRDISERRWIENMKNEFISTINHEIRTPLTSIQGSLGLLRIKLDGKLDEKNNKLLDISYSNCERLTYLINDILDIEKISVGKMRYNFEIAEICAVVKNVVDENEGYAQKYNVKFVIDSPPENIYCKIDVSRFGQALTNLLSNAAKFSYDGEEVVIAIKHHDVGMVKISVADGGDGIPLDFRSRIFQRFAQADNSTKRKGGGTGLGLSIAKSIVGSLNGAIGFDTEEGVGTTFYIILPITK